MGCSDPVAFPSKGAAAGSTTRTFFDFSPNSAQWCLWPGFWTRRAVLQICEPYLLLIFERRQPGCSPWPGTGRNGNGMAGDGPQVISRFLTCYTEEKNKSLKSRMFRDAFLLLLLARLHSHRCHRGIGKPLCRLHNMVTEFQERRLSAEGLRATGPVWACSGDQIRGDPNSWAVEHLPNRFSHLYHQNLRVSVDTVAAHHNVCGK